MNQQNLKLQVGQELAKRVKDGEVIGVGTGSTVDAALTCIGERIKKENLKIAVVPTSYESAWRCEELGLKVLASTYKGDLAWGFDGADQVDKNLWLVKGKGGAMLREKILAAKCKKFIVLVDESKLVEKIDATVSIPVEVLPEALSLAERGLSRLGAKEVKLRMAVKKHGPVISEYGNVILDVCFDGVNSESECQIKSLVGVVESGLFIGYTSQVIVAREGRIEVLGK